MNKEKVIDILESILNNSNMDEVHDLIVNNTDELEELIEFIKNNG